jgi:hypothetical protein
MYIVRDVFKAKPGKSKDLIAKLKSTSPHFKSKGIRNIRLLTDVSSDFWQVIWEFEVEEIQDYFQMASMLDSNEKLSVAIDGYQEYIVSGHREIFQVEQQL